jgi:hypothetical protein
MAYPFMSPTQQRELVNDVAAERAVAGLAQQIEAGTWRNYQAILSLQGQQKMPVDLRREYGRFLKGWKEFARSRDGKYSGQDYLALKNFSDENQRFTLKISMLGKTPAVVPTSPRETGNSGMRVVKHAALGTLGALLLASLYESHSRKLS